MHKAYTISDQSYYNYIYQYKDHLGNVRLNYGFDPVDGEIEIIDEHHYYPFGLEHTYYNTTTKDFELKETSLGSGFITKIEQVANSGYQYKYNGKELQDELDLNWYDYQARNYDPALGRWMNIDPLSEMSRRYSPYAYALDNPVYFIDPDGMLAEGFDGIYIDKDGNKIGEDSKGASDGRVYVVKGSAKRKVKSSTEDGKTIETSELNENKVFELASNEDRQSQKEGILQKSTGVDNKEFAQVNMTVEGVEGTVSNITEGAEVVKGDKKASVEPNIGGSRAAQMRKHKTMNVTVTSMTHTHNVDFAKINENSDMNGAGVPSPSDKTAARNNPSIKSSVINTRIGKVHVLNSKGKYITVNKNVYFKKH